jgi:hypothetical protein
MTDFYLAFPDQAAADAVLYTTHAAVTDEQGNVTAEAYVTPNYANIDTLGVICKDEQAIAGWHVNVRLVDEDPKALLSFAVTPATPMRVWA